MKSLQHHLEPMFTFAGITFPKYVWSIPRGPLSKRLARAKNPVCGPYYHAPRPVESEKEKGIAFYHGEACGPFSLRLEWCDKVEGVDIRHKGWYADEYQDDKFRGIVLRLPKGRGFLAGWSMGEGMCAYVESSAYECERDAAYAADGMAETAAEEEQEAREKANREEEEAREQMEAERLTGALCSLE